jgi:O-antigen ligase
MRKIILNLIYISAGFMPAYLLRFKIGGIPTNVFEILIIMIFATGAFFAIRDDKTKQFLNLPKEKVFRAGVCLLFAGAAVSVIAHPTLRALGILKSWFIVPFMFFILLRYAHASTEPAPGQKMLTKPLLAYSLGAIISILISVICGMPDSLTYDGRFRAFFESPNHLAMLVAPVVIIMAVFTFALFRKTGQTNTIQQYLPFGIEKIDARRTMSTLLLLALVIALWMTKSAGAMLGMSGGFLLAAAYTRVQGNFRALIVAGAMIFGIALPFFIADNWPTVQKYFRIPERSSASSRMMIWRSAIDIGERYPVAGIAMGSFQDEYLANQKKYPPYLEWAVSQPHNVYLAFWLQTGILGIAGLLLLISWFFLKISEIGRRIFAINIEVLLAALMFYMMLHGSVDTLYWKNDLAAFFWMLMALASCRGGSAVSDPA